MRLIDADELINELCGTWKWLTQRDLDGYGTTHGELLDKIYEIINQLPQYETIILRKVENNEI